MNTKRIILGIDPGTQLLGFGIICVEGKNAAYVDMGVLDLRKEGDAYSKLQAIYECIGEVCRNYHPTELAIESPFYGKNAQVVLKLGRAQGAAILAAKEYGVESVTEYAPRKAKEAPPTPWPSPFATSTKPLLPSPPQKAKAAGNSSSRTTPKEFLKILLNFDATAVSKKSVFIE